MLQRNVFGLFLGYTTAIGNSFLEADYYVIYSIRMKAP